MLRPMLDPVHIVVVARASDTTDRLVLTLEQGGYRVAAVVEDREQALLLARVSDVAVVALSQQPRELNEEIGLTPREREVLDALLRGTRPPEIARKFFISVHTVRRHAQAVFRKLGVHSQIELMHRFGSASGNPRRRTTL